MDATNGVTLIDLPLEAVVYREDIYPRSRTNHHKVQEYAENLELMPPIEVNQHHILIDGWHRWFAHKKEARTTIVPRSQKHAATSISLDYLSVVIRSPAMNSRVMIR